MFENQKVRIIYGLVDPRDNCIKYVGCCNDTYKRLYGHLSPRELESSSKKNIWLKELISLNLKPFMQELEVVPIELWEEKEKRWISYFGRENLTNSTDGGFGCFGLYPDEDTRRKISESKIGDKNPFFGKTHTPEEIEKISNRSRGENNPMFGVSPSDEYRLEKSNQEQGVKRRKDTSSKYVGVCRPTGRRKWNAIINFRGKSIRIGSYDTEEEAALAYNKKALELFGPNAKINII